MNSHKPFTVLLDGWYDETITQLGKDPSGKTLEKAFVRFCEKEGIAGPQDKTLRDNIIRVTTERLKVVHAAIEEAKRRAGK